MTTDLITTTAEKSVELQVRAQTAITEFAQRTADRMRNEDGQISAEYLGLLVLVAAIIAAIVKLKLPSTISKAIDKQIDKIA